MFLRCSWVQVGWKPVATSYANAEQPRSSRAREKGLSTPLRNNCSHSEVQSHSFVILRCLVWRLCKCTLAPAALSFVGNTITCNPRPIFPREWRQESLFGHHLTGNSAIRYTRLQLRHLKNSYPLFYGWWWSMKMWTAMTHDLMVDDDGL